MLTAFCLLLSDTEAEVKVSSAATRTDKISNEDIRLQLTDVVEAKEGRPMVRHVQRETVNPSVGRC